MLVILLASCSQRHTPAPVVAVSSGSEANITRKKNSIRSDKYVVKKGETLFSIAWRAGVDFRHLAAINRINKPYRIYPGQVLNLTTKSAAQYAQKKNQKKQIHTQRPSVNKKATAPSGSTNVSSKNNQKKLADTKRGEYGHSKPVNSVPDKKPTKSKSNKIRSWIWPTKGKVISPFSNSESGNKGIDISGRKGQQILAAADGKVVYAGSALRGYGNLIIIKHNDDYLSAYAHNAKLLVGEKAQIKAGQHIADMGSTDAASTRLHFEIRYRGKSVNPLKYLPKR